LQIFFNKVSRSSHNKISALCDLCVIIMLFCIGHCHSQQIIIVDSLGRPLVDKRVVLSAGETTIVRISDEQGKIETLPITSTAFTLSSENLRFISHQVTYKSGDTVIATEFAQPLETVYLGTRRSKKYSYRNHKRLFGLMGAGSFRTMLPDSAEIIVHIATDRRKFHNTQVVSVSFHAENMWSGNPPDSQMQIIHRLNIYDSQRHLIYSEDKGFTISSAEKDLSFEIADSIHLTSEGFYAGLQVLGLRNGSKNHERPRFRNSFLRYEYNEMDEPSTYVREGKDHWIPLSRKYISSLPRDAKFILGYTENNIAAYQNQNLFVQLELIKTEDK